MNRLEMQWTTEEGQLVCHWIETPVVNNETQQPLRPAFSVYALPYTDSQSQWEMNLDLGARSRTPRRAASLSSWHFR